jgi:hypothetical protein
MTLIAFLVHLAGLAAGLLGLSGMARAGRSPTGILVGGAVLSLVMGVFLFSVSAPDAALEDFRVAYYAAGTAVRNAPEGLAPMMERGVDGFVNLPIVAYVFLPFAFLGVKEAVIAFTLLGAACVLASWRMLVRLAELDRFGAALLLFVFAASGPLLYSFKEGNISHLLLMLLVGAFARLRRRQEFLAGLVLGVAAVFKLPLLLYGGYFALRGRWRVVGGGALVCAATGLLSVAVFGWDLHVRWYEMCVKPYGSDPMAAFNVQSVHAFVARLRGSVPGLWDWSPSPLGPTARFAAVAAVAALYAAAVLAAVAPRPARPSGVRVLPRQTVGEMEFLMVLVLACVSSPLSWSHYYAWLLVPAAFFIGRSAHFLDNAATRGLGWAALVMAAPPVILLSFRSRSLMKLYTRSGVSHLLFGGLLMLALLAWARWKTAVEDRARPLPGGDTDLRV